MSRNVMTATPELQTWTKDLATFASSYQAVLERVKELDAQNQELKADLENERQSRRSWMKRTQDVESRIKSQSQYVLFLIDGNQTCFRDQYIRSGSSEEPVNQLMSETHAIAKQQHKNDLSGEFSVIVNIFVDVEQLSQNLLAAGSISTKPQLETFLGDLAAAHPSIALVDCGSHPGAVDAKIKASYELNIENCHCRHIILALGHASDYYKTLDLYSEDEYTKSKTSLVKPENGFPSKYNLPFHAAEVSVLNTVRLIAFSEVASDVHEDALRPSAALPLHLKPSTTPKLQDIEQLPKQSLNGSVSSPSQQAAGSDGSRTVASRSSHSSDHAAPKSNASSVSRKAGSGKHSVHPVSSAVGLPPQAPPDHSSYDEETASYQHDWERRVGQNSYAPPVFTEPWGDEEVVGGNNIKSLSNENNWPKPSSSHRQPPASISQRRQVYQPPNDSTHVPKPAAHTDIQSFDGAWDEQVLPEEGTISATALAPSTNGLAPTPDRPIRSEIALNKSARRIDLPLPSPSSQDWERFASRTKRQKLCNEHHLRHACHDRACRYDHSDIDAGLLLALRHTARTIPCDFGAACRRHECFGAHRCPFMEKPGGCRKQLCAFRKAGLHNISDLEIVEIIPIP